MITEGNGITINYIGQKTDDLYVSEIKCKEDENDSNFVQLQKICVHLTRYKRYKDSIDNELQSIKQRKIAGLFLFLRQLKQNNIAFETAYAVLEFPFLTYCLDISRIDPSKYNFSSQIRERIKNAVLDGIQIATQDQDLNFLKTCKQIKSIYVRYENNLSTLSSIYVFCSKKCRLIHIEKIFNIIREALIPSDFQSTERFNLKKLAESTLKQNENDVWALCNSLQEILIIFPYDDVNSFKDVPDSLKYIFDNTGGKYLYLEQFTDLYAHIFNCSFQSGYKMWRNYHTSSIDKSQRLWKEYEQQITNPEYYKVAKKLKTMKHKNLRCSYIYTLLYAIFTHMCYIKSKKLRQNNVYEEQK
ncbi:MAG: hypothetical protein IJ184_02915 [Alphaproteobacteria bacterium]|nr:hypothetical protein [Alphaproteobacteria bacterium]